ncbi:sporulation integral membrane protein YlbJ [uncultured Clostridium sp.]|uniref:sporulation integral membrane protein YlbJ n=1 Tax=uncultured Clostridium sp. TaxID=59620 RepID=UPI0025DF1ECC|nr:sporulation integral membrane protein YlbJ [uncultured Clostridium sp.]
MLYIAVLWLFIILLTLLLKKQIDIKVNSIVCIIITILIVLFVANINQCITAALDGCKLWYKAILPTTFPFLIICNLLISYDGISLYSRFLGPIVCRPLSLSKNCSFPIAASVLCGYPLGGKYCADIYTMGYIEKDEYIRLLNIASNVGPLFLIGSVASALLNNIAFGYILLAGSYISCLFMGFITKKKRTVTNTVSLKTEHHSSPNLGVAVKNSIENSITTILNIGGFIVIFSVIISLIKNNEFITFIIQNIEHFFKIPSGALYSVLLGSIEITNGCSILSSLSISIPLKLSLISFLCSFSGLAIIAQVISFVGNTGINLTRYIIFKFIQGIFAFIITYFLMMIVPSSVYTSNIVIISESPLNHCLIPVIFMLVLSILFKIFNVIIPRNNTNI